MLRHIPVMPEASEAFKASEMFGDEVKASPPFRTSVPVGAAVSCNGLAEAVRPALVLPALSRAHKR